MDYIIKSLPNKRRNISDKEREIIKRALVSYTIVLNQYEKYTDDMKRKDLEKLQKLNSNNLSSINPFDTDLNEDKSYEPTLEDTKIFVYSSWAEAVANVQIPYICDGQKKKAIRKKAFKDVQSGKFLSKKVRETMDAFILNLYGKNVKEN